jgi:hypothetical protein
MSIFVLILIFQYLLRLDMKDHVSYSRRIICRSTIDKSRGNRYPT